MVFLSLLLCFQAWADGPLCIVQNKSSVNSLKQVAQKSCQELKASPRCQNFYKTLSAEDAQKKALKCSEDDSVFGTLKSGAEYYAGCYVGGWAMIVDPLRDIYQGTKSFVSERMSGQGSDSEEVLAAAKAERELCDRDPALKLQLVQNYNASAPKLLKIKVPSQSTLQRSTCSAIVSTLKAHHQQKMDEIGNSLMRKELIGEVLTDDEKSFVEFRNSELQVEGLDIAALAKQQIEQMGIEIDCYNNYYSARITCEALSTVATLAMGPAGVALKAAKVSKLAKIAGVTSKSERGTAVAATRANAQSRSRMLSDLSAEERSAELARRASLSKEERVKEVEARLTEFAGGKPRTLSEAEREALENAHNVALGTGRGNNGTYLPSDISEKMKTLKRGEASLTEAKASAAAKPNFTPAERKFLMEEGYAGHAASTPVNRAAADRARLTYERGRNELIAKQQELRRLEFSPNAKPEKIQQLKKEIADLPKTIEDARQEAARKFDDVLADKLYPLSERDYNMGAILNARAGGESRLKLAGELYIKSKKEVKYVEGGVPKRVPREQVIFEDLQTERDQLMRVASQSRGTPTEAVAKQNLEIHMNLIKSVVDQLPQMPSQFKSQLLGR